MIYGLARRCGWVVKWGLTDTGDAEKESVAVSLEQNVAEQYNM